MHEFFGEATRAVDITSDRITAYKADRQGQVYQDRPVASATINYELAMLRRAFRLAVEAGKVATRPVIKMLHVSNTRKGFFEESMYQAVLDRLPNYLKPVITAAYITGWRTQSELLTRQWRHVDLHTGWLRLDPGETKNGEGRLFPLTSKLRAMLEAQRDHVRKLELATGQVIPWVFVHDDGRRIKKFRYAWIKACRDAGFPQMLVHDFRRTAIRGFERAGISQSAATKLTGHETEAVYRLAV